MTPRHTLAEGFKRQRDLVRRTKRRRRIHPMRDVLRVAGTGVDQGLVPVDATKAHWDLSRTCTAPVPVALEGREHVLDGAYHKRRHGGRRYTLDMETRCRKCPACLRARAHHWAQRARREIGVAPRTWFCTFTFAPEQHVRLAMMTTERLASGGTNYDLLSADEQWSETIGEYGAELTKYIKRLRKNTGAPLRYCLVAEPHKNGYPHFHALIHEVDPSKPIRHASLTLGWKLGYTNFKLVSDPRVAWYVAKYLSKSLGCRVRASEGYGRSLQGRKIINGLPSSGPTGQRDDPAPSNDAMIHQCEFFEVNPNNLIGNDNDPEDCN